MPRKEPTPKAARLAKGLTQAQLSQASGLSIATIQRHERSAAWPRWTHVAAAYRKALGLS